VDITLEVPRRVRRRSRADGGWVHRPRRTALRTEDTVEETSTSTQTQSEYGEYHVPGDFSSISYLLAAGVLAAEGRTAITSAYPSAQGDTAIVDVVDRMGGDVDWDQDDGLITARRSDLTGVEVSVADTPDLLPTDYRGSSVPSPTERPVSSTVSTSATRETDRVSAMAEWLSPRWAPASTRSRTR